LARSVVVFTRVNFAKLSLLSLFFIVSVLQLFSFPGQFAHMRKENGASLLLTIALAALLACLFLCAQISIFALWKIICHIDSNSFYSANSFLWMNRLVGTLKVATVFPVLLILIIAPQADDPGVLVLLAAITLFVVTVFVISSLLRDQIQNSPYPLEVG
jgi:hypothetical protein